MPSFTSKTPFAPPCSRLSHLLLLSIALQRCTSTLYLPSNKARVPQFRKSPLSNAFQLTFFELMYHVIFAGGYDLPTLHTALMLSLMPIIFLSTCKVGSSFGNSTTCMYASRIAVWNTGASSDTSHLNLPESSRVMVRNVTDVESDDSF